MKVFSLLFLSAILIVGGQSGCTAATADKPLSRPPPFLLHFPGIAGNKPIDKNVTRGIREGGFDGEIQIYDWTLNDPGMDALVAYHRNHQQAAKASQLIAQHRIAQPDGKIFVMGHSGGAGLAIWALEDLPDDVTVNTVVLMSPAVSPDYDLSKALRHVTGKMYVFSSLTDVIVLGMGTKLFGTIDGVKTDAAGRVGFRQPSGADPAEYAKLVPMPYDTAWYKYHDIGDHIGGMTRTFGKNVLAPLLLEGKMPPTSEPTTTQTPSGIGRKLPGIIAP